MTAVKYFIAWCKKNNIVNFIPLVFLVPIFTMVFLNIIEYIGDNYNNYKFIKNSNYGSYNIYADRKEAKENYYVKLSSYMFIDYLPELSIDEFERYDNRFYSNFFFINDVNLLNTSFFTKENLLSGQYPKDNKEIDLLPDGTIPIYISFDASKFLKCNVGEKVYASVIEKIDIRPTYKQHFTTLEFTVVGILRPYSVRFRDEYVEPHIALAFVNNETFERISKFHDDQISYIKFTVKTLEESKTTRIRKNELANIKSNFESDKTRDFVTSTILYITIVVLMEISYLNKKRQSDLRILRMLGLNKFNAKLSILLMAAFIMSIGSICSLLIIKFMYIDYIILKHYEWTFLILLASIMYLVILLTSSVYLAVIRIDSNQFVFKSYVEKILKSKLKHLYKGDK